jgi:hypothetical protein
MIENYKFNPLTFWTCEVYHGTILLGYVMDWQSRDRKNGYSFSMKDYFFKSKLWAIEEIEIAFNLWRNPDLEDDSLLSLSHV